MPLFRFDLFGYDIECPNCKSKLGIIWNNTEYSDPKFGEYVGKCPKCKNEIIFECYVIYNVLKKEKEVK